MTHWHEIMEAIGNSKQYYTANAIFSKIRKINPDVNITSIRHQLKKMYERGEIERQVCITINGRIFIYRKK